MWTYRGDEPTVVEWLTNIRLAHEAHLAAARQIRRRHRAVGLLTAALGTATATVVLVDLLTVPGGWGEAGAGALAIATALAALLLAFTSDAAQAADHQRAATEHAGLRRQLEQAILSERITDDRLAEIRATWTRLEQSSPSVPPRAAREGRRRLAEARPVLPAVRQTQPGTGEVAAESPTYTAEAEAATAAAG